MNWNEDHVKAALAAPRTADLFIDFSNAVTNGDHEKANELAEELVSDKYAMLAILAWMYGFIQNSNVITGETLIHWATMMSQPFIERN